MTYTLHWTTDDSAGVLDVNAALPADAAAAALPALYRQVWQRFADAVLSVPQGYSVSLVRAEFWPDTGQLHLIPSTDSVEPVGRNAQLNLRITALEAAWLEYEKGEPLQPVQDLAHIHAAAMAVALKQAPLPQGIRVEWFWFDEPMPTKGS